MPVSGPVQQPIPRGDPQWGEVLQLPNLHSQFDVAGAERDAWMARNGAMTGAQQTAMEQLTAALKAERDAKMAELMKQNAGGGHGRGGGGGGASPVTLPPYAPPTTPWGYNPTTAPAPSLNMPHLDPSTIYGPNNVYTNTIPHPGGRALVAARAGQSAADVNNNRGLRPTTSPKPSTYKVTLS